MISAVVVSSHGITRYRLPVTAPGDIDIVLIVSLVVLAIGVMLSIFLFLSLRGRKRSD